MWVWRGLGYEHVTELPSGALNALGQRCRRANSELSTHLFSSGPLDAGLTGLSSSPGRAREPPLRDEQGDLLDLSPAALGSVATASSRHATSTWRLAPLGNLRLCVPGAVELAPGPPALVVDAGNGIKTIKGAIQNLAANGGGSFQYRVPMVDAHLREDVAEESCAAPAPHDWPLCVVGVVLGASLRLCVSTQSGASITQSTQLPSVGGGADETPSLLIQCDGFQLQILQRGGPPVDPAKLHGCTPEEVATELERWAKKSLVARPGTWRTLFANVKLGASESAGMSSVPPSASIEARGGGRQLGDVVLAVAADTELSLEPFELSYGDAHVSSLKRMLEDEVANVLHIESERVMCGEFAPQDRGTRKRHVRRDTIMLRFALLNSELMELVRAKELPRRPSRKSAASLNAALKLGGSLTSTVGSPSNAKDTGAFSVSFKAGSDFLSPKAQMSKMTLTNMSPKSKATLSMSRSEPTLSIGDTGKDLPPDLLLKSLIRLLADSKHPLRRHPDAFPMLSRIVSGGVRTNAQLVANKDVISPTPGKLADGIRTLMRVRKNTKRETELDTETRSKLSTMRSEILKIYSAPDGAIVASKQQLNGLSAKELLDATDGSIAKPTELQACLEMLVEHTSSNVEWCLRLRSHKGVERVIAHARRFISDRGVVTRCMSILNNLTLNDMGCVDALLEQLLAPELITVLDNLYTDQVIQLNGCRMLKRLYLRAREVSSHGPRVITLGKGLDEVWTFKGITRALETMRLFQDDAEIQLESCTMLASLGELLYNNGMAVDTFKILEVVMRKHHSRPDILAKGVSILARMGPSFLAHENRGATQIVDAMARHRSSVELQRVGTKALFALSKQEDALACCRAGGSVGAILSAICAHSKDEQVLREGTRALEKHCPRALAKAIRVCGDIAAVLPPIAWSTDPLDAFIPSHFDLSELRDSSEWDTTLLENFVGEHVSRHGGGEYGGGYGGNSRPQSRGDSGGQGLASLHSYRRVGLREELDAADNLWAVPGSSQMSLPSLTGDLSEARRRLDGGISSLKKQECDIDHLHPSQPTSEQLKKLCEALNDGLGPKQYSAQDAEMLASLLGHFAWASSGAANDIMAAGGATACVAWLRTSRVTTRPNPEETGLAYPMHSACLGMLSCLSRDPDCASTVLELDGVGVALQYATKAMDQRCQRSAVRLLSRLIPAAAKSDQENVQVPTDKAWPIILRELKSKDENSRTAAAACALEAAGAGWMSTDHVESSRAPYEELAEALLWALTQAAKSNSTIAALPVLLTISLLVSSEEENDEKVDRRVARALYEHSSLVQQLVAWLPKATVSGATAADSAAATAAATALQSLTELGAKLLFGEMAALLRHGSSAHAEPALRQACNAALDFAVKKETSAELLAQLFATNVGDAGAGSTERLAGLDVLQLIAQRMVNILKMEAGQATDVLFAALGRADPLIPRDLKESAPVCGLVSEAKAFKPARNVSSPPSRPDTGATGTLPPLNQAGNSSTNLARSNQAGLGR